MSTTESVNTAVFEEGLGRITYVAARCISSWPYIPEEVFDASCRVYVLSLGTLHQRSRNVERTIVRWK